MQCDPVLILIPFRYQFLIDSNRFECKTLQNPCVWSAVSKGEWESEGGGALEHADDLGADIFHTFHT